MYNSCDDMSENTVIPSFPVEELIFISSIKKISTRSSLGLSNDDVGIIINNVLELIVLEVNENQIRIN